MPAPVARLVALAALLLTLAAPLAAQEQAAADAPPPLPAEVVDPAADAELLALRLAPLTREELARAAEAWLGIVKAKTEEVVAAQIEAREAADEAAADAAQERAAELAEERRDLFSAFSTVVTAWERKAGDPDAIAAYRAYRTAILLEETRTTDVQTLLQQTLRWATSRDGGIALALDAALVIVSLLALLFVARLVRRLARRGVERVPNLSRLLQAFVVVVVYWLVLAFGLLVVLTSLGVDVTPVFALIGGASFILAFALQSTLGNLAAGLMIMINRPFDEGDYVSVAGVSGTVKSVSVMSTTVTTPDNQVIVIPNSGVWGDVITNVTASPERRVDLVFGIGYDDDVDAALRILEELCAAHPLVLAEPEPNIRLSALGDSAVELICRPWAKGEDVWTVHWDLTRQVKSAFDAAGISIPYPQRDVHLHAVGAAAAAATPAAAPRAAGRSGAGAEAAHDEGHDPDGAGEGDARG